MRQIAPELHERLKTLISSMGYELIGCEMQAQGRQTVFRIYIDKPYIDKPDADAETGITLEDCSLVSHQVSAMMDVEDPIEGRYNLEISSPGIDRPLFELAHYQKFIGSRVKLRLNSLVNQRKHYKGVLKSVNGEDIHILVDGSGLEVIVPFSTIEKANLIGDIRL